MDLERKVEDCESKDVQYTENFEKRECLEDVFYYACKKCSSASLSVNSALLLPDPDAHVGFTATKKRHANFLYCPKCKLLENMEGKFVKDGSKTGETAPPESTKEATTNFLQAISDYFS